MAAESTAGWWDVSPEVRWSCEPLATPLARWDGRAGRCLDPTEREVLDAIRDRGRRDSWLAGRLCAKELIFRNLIALRGAPSASDLSCIAIHSRDGGGRAVRPWVTIDGRTRPLALSIAHSDGSVLTALVEGPEVGIGVDLTRIGAATERFTALWFTESERRWVETVNADQRTRATATIWAVKEAFYKATNGGHRFMPRAIEVRRDDGRLTVHAAFARVSACEIEIEERAREIAALVLVRPERRGIA